MSYEGQSEYGPEPDWMDGYTGAQEAKEDHFATVGESTSARLRRVEQELADERDKRSQDIAAYERACNVLAAYEVELASVKAELGKHVVKALRERNELVAVADKLNDENLALKVELEQLRQKLTTALTERLDALAEIQQLRHQADLGPKAADRQERES